MLDSQMTWSLILIIMVHKIISTLHMDHMTEMTTSTSLLYYNLEDYIKT